MSTPNVPNLVIPRVDLSLASIQQYTQAADGSWSVVGSALSFLKYIDSIIVNVKQELMPAVSVDSAFVNRVPTLIDGSVSIIENQRRATATGSAFPILSAVINGGPVKFTFAYNGSTAGNDVVTMYGYWSSFTMGAQGVGHQKMGITIDLADTSYTTVGGITGVAPFSVVRA